MVRCQVVGCSSTHGMPNITLHRFPSVDSLCLEWSRRCGARHPIPGIKSKRLCSLHFNPDDYNVTPGGRRLLDSALPSVAIPPTPAYEVDICVGCRPTEGIYFINVEGRVIRVSVTLGAANTTPVGVVLQAEKILPPANQGVIWTTTNDVVNEEAAHEEKQKKLEGRAKRMSNELKYFKERNRKNLHEKIELKRIQNIRISKKRAQMYGIRRKLVATFDGKIKVLDSRLTKYHSALSKIFTEKQISLLLSGRKQAKWSNADIGRFISYRYKSNMYEFLRSQGFPFASTRTLQRFTSKIDFRPGLLLPIINLLKIEFEDAPEIKRQCILSFDEMSLEGSFAYDATEDRVYPPSANINVYFIRGLHENWKQMISYELDDKFHPEKIKNMISIVESIGLRVRGMTCDLGGKNRGLLNKLGVKVRKMPTTASNYIYCAESSFKNPTRPNDDVWCFPDAPHLVKLLRDNLFKHGFVLEDGITLTKNDFEKLVQIDSSEMRSNYKLGRKHLDVKGLEKTTVSLAVQLFSNTTAALWNKVYPNRQKQGQFIKVINDWFDTMNSRNIQEPQFSKSPFGLHLQQQFEVLNNMEESITKLRVGSAKQLYPFQRGILLSINSIRGLFHDLSGSSLRIRYILTHRVNQDLLENAFSIVRKTGAFHSRPSVVDAKQRFKLLCLSQGGNNLKTSAVEGEDDRPCLSARMMSSLISVSPSSYPPPSPPLWDVSDEVPTINVLTQENLDVVMRSMGISQSCETGGKEWVAGFVASKFGWKYPQLVANAQEEQALKNHSWVMALKKGGLTIPSLECRNEFAILEQEFDQYHSVGGTNQINLEHGVLKGFTAALMSKYPQFLPEPLSLFIRTKMFIRIKSANNKLKEERRKAAERRWQFGQNAQRTVSHEEEEEDDFENREEETESDVEDQVLNVTNSLDWETLYQRYLDGEA